MRTVTTLQVLTGITGGVHKIARLIKAAMGPSQQKEQPSALTYLKQLQTRT